MFLAIVLFALLLAVNGLRTMDFFRLHRPALALGSSELPDPAILLGGKEADYNALAGIEITATIDGRPRQMGSLILEKDVTALIAFRSFG